MSSTELQKKNFQVYDDLGCYDQREMVPEAPQPSEVSKKNFQVYPDGGSRTTGDICNDQPSTQTQKNFQIQRSATCVRQLL